ncbi:MAG TPA: hypothetical protein VNH83_11905 [Bryobacteraceae bacterium]|nr:hypothetical protein [Bryobacteraceae bacterium]
MPLIESPSKSAIGTNIKRELDSGKNLAQSRAIALSEARKNGANIPPPNRRRYQPNMGMKMGFMK